MKRLAIVVLLAGLAHAAGAGEEPEDAHARARRALEALVRELAWDRPPTSPSLTRCLADFAACGDEAVRGVLAEFWARAKERHSLAWIYAEHVESLVRMLYGLEPDPRRSRSFSSFRVFGGAVLHCARTGPGSGPPYSPSLPPLDELLAGRALRPVPVPDAKALLDAVRTGETEKWSRRERECGYAALGEVPGRDPAMTRWKMRSVGEIVSAVAPAELRAAIAAAEGETRMELLRLAGMEISIPILLAEYDAAETREARLGAFRRVRDLILSYVTKVSPRAADVPRLLDLFLAVAPELPESERDGLWRAAEWLFYAGSRHSISGSFASGEVALRETGGSIGPYPDMETTARNMKEDAAAGRLVFLDPGEGPGVFAPPLRRLGTNSERAFSDVKPPEFMSKPQEGFPVFAAAKWVPEGLEISLTNRGKEPFLVNPRIARYARAEVTIARGKGPRVGTSLRLDLGFINARTAVPAAALVRVDPGGAFRWVQPVRPEHRDVGSIVISFRDADDGIGAADHPVLAALNDTWIR